MVLELGKTYHSHHKNTTQKQDAPHNYRKTNESWKAIFEVPFIRRLVVMKFCD